MAVSLAPVTLRDAEESMSSAVRYLIDRILVAEGRSERTREWYETQLAEWLRFCEEQGLVRVQDVRRSDVVDFMTWLQARKPNAQPTTLNGYLRAVRRFFRSFLDDLINADPTRRVKKLPEPEKLPLTLNEAEMRKLLDQFDRRTFFGSRNYHIVAVLLATGIRADECAGLRVRDLDTANDALRVVRAKYRKERLVALPSNLSFSLERYLRKRDLFLARHGHEGEALFPSKTGTHLARDTITRIVADALERGGLDIPGRKKGAHILRHSYGHQAVLKGASTLALQRAMGHSSPSVTAIYTRLAGAETLEVSRSFACWPGD